VVVDQGVNVVEPDPGFLVLFVLVRLRLGPVSPQKVRKTFADSQWLSTVEGVSAQVSALCQRWSTVVTCAGHVPLQHLGREVMAHP
jgi:hypothetical protein